MNILDIPVAVVSSLGEGLHIIYPRNHSQEEADFDSIALVGHEAESDISNGSTDSPSFFEKNLRKS